MSIKAIILSAGQGKRMNSDVPKQYLDLDQKPIIYHTIKAFHESFVDEIILVCGANDIDYCTNEIVKKYSFTKVKQIVAGGAERYDSVLNGLRAAGICDYIFIHDGARPFVTRDVLERTLISVKEHKACIVAVPVKDTIKVVAKDGKVDATPKRSTLYQVQTPQAFSYSIIKDVYESFALKRNDEEYRQMTFTDDAMMVETFSDCPVYVVEGNYDNIKITTPEDIQIGERILERRK